MKVLMTGATGFIGSHATEHFLKKTDWDLILLEGLNYASSMQRLTDIDIWPSEHSRVKVFYHDIRAPFSDDILSKIGQPDFVIHFAAETHVDKALIDPKPFVDTNVIGTFNMLEFSRKVGVGLYVQISTDEVYGPAQDNVFFKEGDPYKPSNPYSATKAGADCLAYSYYKSFGLPVIITNTMNNFGERQHPEKFIPKTIKAISESRKILLHGKPGDVGSRCWLHARNHADAVLFLLNCGNPGEQYHISSNDEYDVYEMADKIASCLGSKLNGNIEYLDYHNTRPGHDKRYALDGSKIKNLGWTPPVSFDESLQKTIRWTMDHPEWVYLSEGVKYGRV